MRKENLKRGFTIVELALVLAVVAVLLVGAFIGYNRVYLPAKADSISRNVLNVLTALERARSDNGGAYPALTFTIGQGGGNLIESHLGGTGTALNDVAGWRYACTAGASSTVTLTTTNLTGGNQTLANLILAKLRTSLASGYQIQHNNGVFTITIPNVPCR